MIGNKNKLNFASDGIIALETQAYFRWNFLRLASKKLGTSGNTTNFFIQGGMGMIGALRGPDYASGPNEKNTRASLLFDATTGITIPLGSKWHIEPSIRGGYPFVVGFALTVGYKFPLPLRTVYQNSIEYVEVERTNEIMRRILITQIEYIIFGPDISRFNAEIDSDARALNELVIDHVAKTLTGNPSLRVRIEGHANPVTHAPDEIQVLSALSENRANEVARLLRERGVEEDQIIVVALGGTRAIAHERDRWNVNRRVELMIIQGDIN